MNGPLRWGCVVLAISIAPLSGCSSDETAPLAPLYQGRPPHNGPPSNVVGGFIAQLPDYTLSAGSEEFPCWIVPIELNGPSEMVGGAKLSTGPGLHHGNLTTRPKTGEGLRPCPAEDAMEGAEALDIVAGGGWIYASSTQLVGEEWQTFPDGNAYRIDTEFELVARMHYVNTTAEDVVVAPLYEWFTVDPSTVVNVLAPFGFLLAGFEIPPGATYTGTGGCRLEPFNILSLLPHMHALGESFTAEFMGGERDGEKFLESRGYDPDNGVNLQYQPAVDLSIADGIRFSCTWKNTFSKTIVEGVGDNEMCMLFGYGYPADKVQTGFAVSPDNCFVVKGPDPNQ